MAPSSLSTTPSGPSLRPLPLLPPILTLISYSAAKSEVKGKCDFWHNELRSNFALCLSGAVTASQKELLAIQAQCEMTVESPEPYASAQAFAAHKAVRPHLALKL